MGVESGPGTHRGTQSCAGTRTDLLKRLAEVVVVGTHRRQPGRVLRDLDPQVLHLRAQSHTWRLSGVTPHASVHVRPHDPR